MSADRPPAAVTDNPSSASPPSQDKPVPQQQDFRADRERNDAVVRKPPMQRVPDARTDTGSRMGSEDPRPGSDRSRDAASGTGSQDKRAPSGYQSDLEHNRAVMARPPMQRPDSAASATQRPDTSSHDVPPASAATQHSGSDAGTSRNRTDEHAGTGPDNKTQVEDRPAASGTTAPSAAENSERTGPASTDNGNAAGQRTAEGPRGPTDETSSTPLVQGTADDASRSPDHASLEEHSEPQAHGTNSPTTDSAEAATPEARNDTAGNANDPAHDQHGDQAPPDPAEARKQAVAPTEATAQAPPHEQAAPDAQPGEESALEGVGTADSAKEPRPSTEEQGDSAITSEGSLSEGTYGSHLSWTTLPPEGRTVGDTTPAGIGMRPSGEQLLDMAKDRGSRLDRGFGVLFDHADDLREDASEAAKELGAADSPPAGGTTAHVVGHHPSDGPAHEATLTTDAVGATVLAVVGIAAGLRCYVTHGRTHRT